MLKKYLLFFYLSVLFTQYTFAEDISRWHLPEGAKARLGKGSIEDFAYSPDGTRLAVASSIGIYLHETASYREVALFTEQTAWLDFIKFSPDGKTIAGVDGTEETTVRLWDAKTGKHKHSLDRQTNALWGVAFSPDGNTIVCWGGGLTDIVPLWDAKTGKHKHSLKHTHGIHSVMFSPDGRTITTESFDQKVRLWDAKTGKHTYTLTGYADRIHNVAFSPDGKILATGSDDGTLRLWDANTGILKHTLTGHTSRIYSIAFSPNGKTIATGSGDGTVLLWDVQVTNDRYHSKCGGIL